MAQAKVHVTVPEVDAALVDRLMLGAVDLHVHSGPSLMPRRLDHVEALRAADAAGMAAIVLKDHYYPTMPIATLLNSHLGTKAKAIGSVVLNNPLGDFNVHAAAAAPEAPYTAAIARELASYAGRPPFGGRPLASLYLGGGTPSLLSPAAVAALLDAARMEFALAPNGASARTKATFSATCRAVRRSFLTVGVIYTRQGASKLLIPKELHGNAWTLCRAAPRDMCRRF